MSILKRNIQTMLLITGLIKVIGFAYKILLARYFDMEVLSTISLLAPILNMSLVLSSLSIPSIVNKYVASATTKRPYSNRSFISSAVYITLISSSFVLIFIISLSSFIATNLYQNSALIIPIIVSAPLIYFSNMSGIMKGYLEAHDNFKHPAISNLIEQIWKISALLIILFLFKDLKVNTLCILLALTLLIAEILSNIYLLCKVSKMTPLTLKPSLKKEASGILKPSIYLTLFALIFTISSFLEPLIYYSFTKHIFINQNQTKMMYTSIHSLILPFMQIASFLTYVLVKILFPRFAKASSNKDISYYIYFSFYVLLFVNIPLFILSFFYPQEVLELFYRKSNFYIVLKILSPVTLYTFLSPIITTALHAKGYEKKLFKNSLISTIIGLVSLMIFSLIPKTALYALLISLILKELLYFSYNLILSIKYFKLKFKIQHVLYLATILIVTFLLNKVTNDLSTNLRIIIVSIVPVFLYTLVFLKVLRPSLD